VLERSAREHATLCAICLCDFELDEACRRLLANTVIEEYRIEIGE